MTFPTTRMRNPERTNGGTWLRFELVANSTDERMRVAALLTAQIPATERSHVPSWRQGTEMADIWEIKLTDSNVALLRQWLPDVACYLDSAVQLPLLVR